MARRRIWTRVVYDYAGVLDEAASSWYWYDGPLALAMNNPSVDQDHFRFYEPGTEAASVGIAVEDANITRLVATPFQIRIALQETGNANTGNTQYELRYSKNSGAFTDVTASSLNVQAVDDPNIVDNAVTTDRIGGTGGFDPGRFDDVDGTLTSSLNIQALRHTEVLFSITIITADVADADTLDFRIFEVNDTVLSGVYNITPRVTVDKPAVTRKVVHIISG